MLRIDMIQGKLKQINESILDLENRDRVMMNLGGAAKHEDVKFQRERRDILHRMLLEGEELSQRRLAAIEVELGPASKLKYGSVRGVPEHVVKLIAFAELLELGLGIHPALAGGRS